MQAARRPWHVVLYVLALAMLVALVAAVSSWAAGDPAPAQQTTPIQYQAPEAEQPQAPEGDGSGRTPCPEDEGGGSQQQQQQGSESDSTV
jgi:hypothetical protein